MIRILIIALFVGTIANAGFLDSIMGSVSSVSTPASENKTLIDKVKNETGLNTTQTTGALGTLLGYAGNNLSANEYSSITNSVPGLGSLTSSPAISPIVSSLTSSKMVSSTLQGFGVDPSLLTTIIPILVNYVSSTGGESSGNLLSSALSGLM